MINRRFSRLLGVWLVMAMIFSLAYDLTSANGGATITLDPTITFQTMVGWEATTQSGEFDCPGFDQYSDALFDMAVNDLGINRLRVEVYSGLENPVDYFPVSQQEGVTEEEQMTHWNDIRNDNADPFKMDPKGFQFSYLDHRIETIVLPLRDRLMENGEHLFLNFTYVDFLGSPFEHKGNPEEYAEFVLAVYEHLEKKYGFVPDAWEIILEPDSSARWSARQIGEAIVATGKRLERYGYEPYFVAPSNKSMGNAVKYFDAMIIIPGVSKYLKEISYHRYADVSDQALQKISERAQKYGMRTAMLEHIGSGYKDLHQDLAIGMNSAWQQYTLAYCTEDNGGKYFRIDNTDPTKPVAVMESRARILRQYFHYLRSGAIRIEAVSQNPEFDPLAFINPDGSYVVVVKANQTGGEFSIAGLPPGRYGVSYSTKREHYVQQPEVKLGEGESLTAKIPGAGALTVYQLPEL